jgi:hypothetical protein
MWCQPDYPTIFNPDFIEERPDKGQSFIGLSVFQQYWNIVDSF